MTEFITLGPKAIDITGQRFGRLVALGPVKKSPDRKMMWLCQCDCGNSAIVSGKSMRTGITKSCGCLQKERASEGNWVHGMTKHPLFHAWREMNRRCLDPSNKRFASYGARGITICDEWRHHIDAFYDHVSQLPHYGEKGYSIDRIDNDLGYFPGNVRWATAKEQGRNRRTNIVIAYNGKEQCISAWAQETGLSSKLISIRLQLGWSAERTLSTPVRRRQPRQSDK